MNSTSKGIVSLLGKLPGALQYIAIVALVMGILALCLWLSRKIAARFDGGEKTDYNDPEACDAMVPDLFASTALHRKNKQKAEAEKSDQD